MTRASPSMSRSARIAHAIGRSCGIWTGAVRGAARGFRRRGPTVCANAGCAYFAAADLGSRCQPGRHRRGCVRVAAEPARHVRGAGGRSCEGEAFALVRTSQAADPRSSRDPVARRRPSEAGCSASCRMRPAASSAGISCRTSSCRPSEGPVAVMVLAEETVKSKSNRRRTAIEASSCRRRAACWWCSGRTATSESVAATVLDSLDYGW